MRVNVFIACGVCDVLIHLESLSASRNSGTGITATATETGYVRHVSVLDVIDMDHNYVESNKVLKASGLEHPSFVRCKFDRIKPDLM
jgi:hypothetical protein